MKRIFAFSLLLVAVYAWSGNPIPGAPKTSSPNQIYSIENAKAVAEVKQPPNQSPAAPVVVNVFASPEAKESSGNNGEHDNQETPWKDGWEAIGAIATIILAGITAYLAYYTKGLWTETVKLGNEAESTSKRQAKEMQDSIAIANASIDIARQEFIASHRPKIIVRSFQIVDRDLPAGKEVNFIFVGQNIGDTTAKIIELRNGTFVQSTKTVVIPGDLSFAFRENLIPDLALKSGESNLFPGNGGSMIEGNESMEIYAGDSALYCMGIIVYIDEIGTRRETGFCRRYHPRENRWDVIDCEYEYAY